MCSNNKGGFVPPDASKLVVRCPVCKTFNSPKNLKCKKCGEAMLKKEE
ncbi:MAG: hypothetical protein H6Q74_62 [Firmicutes bacterium]|nr:hypothetical protein [Bacillota bacterium]